MYHSTNLPLIIAEEHKSQQVGSWRGDDFADDHLSRDNAQRPTHHVKLGPFGTNLQSDNQAGL